MDILTHILSGFAVGTALAGRSTGTWRTKTSIILFSGLGGALPDIDAISMWSKFDMTFGRLFGLSHSGKVIYSAKFWYSHHGFMHSLMAALIFTLVLGCLFWLFSKRERNSSLIGVFCKYKLLLIGFVSGFVIHLLQDMITPASSWGGVRLFFPHEIYIGGTGDIWWWNNYNLFLVVVGVILVNICLLLIFRKDKVRVRKFTASVFLIGCLCFAWQIMRIGYNFNGKNYTDCELKSKEIQREILGEKIYRKMEKLDNFLIIYF
ncbi:metal-dependent hydrolase [Bacteroides sp. 51]|uniref:metal-dependent hydrolase n=1 Tax=Bacteroides sp. 51 TaxID=2302938 RepID=UPI0013D3B075|nr:metal-dependent hydrolase [Bacteroides sp. 51]NDV83317.1 metal-dependent hydrolase [Bacteroides sp. 51]